MIYPCGSVRDDFRRGTLRTGVKLDQQYVVLWGDALKADPIGIQMMPDRKPVRCAGSLIHRANGQREPF